MSTKPVPLTDLQLIERLEILENKVAMLQNGLKVAGIPSGILNPGHKAQEDPS
jgi:hypothetical protein